MAFASPRAVLLSGLVSLALVAEAPRRSLEARRVEQAPVIDGRLDEAIWAQAPAATGFRVTSPELGAPARRDTTVKVLYDNDFLYVGARMHHPGPAPQILAPLHRRDQDSASDWFAIYVDSLHDRNTALSFMVNAAGVQQDRVIYQDTNEDSSWDGVWESAVHQDAQGWTAELKIPLALLRLQDTSAPQTWGVNFLRVDCLPSREVTLWQIVPRGVSAWVSTFPDLTGIQGVRPRPRREWIPYLSTQRKFETSQPYDDRTWTHRAGLDAHLGLSARSQLDLTLRPDFGQVEVDQAVLNLGTYETFFPEKRPFFLEGMEQFQFTGPQLFYSRRIGKGLGDPALAEGERLLDRPAAAEILGAAKWTTKGSGGLDLGILGARVERAEARVLDASGQEVRRTMAPATDVAVLRGTWRLGQGGGFLGGFGSALHQQGPGGRQALVGGADLSLPSRDQSGRLDLSFAGTRTGTPGATRQGTYARLAGEQAWKNGWAVNGTLLQASRDFDPNDLGFSPRGDRQMLKLNAERAWDAPAGPFLNRRWHTFYTAERDLAGRLFTHTVGTWLQGQFRNQWSLNLSLFKDLPTWDDRELRTFRQPVKTYLRVDGTPTVSVNLESPHGGPWSGGLRLARPFRQGGPTLSLGIWQSIRPLPQLEIQLESGFDRESGDLHHVDTLDSGPVVGRRHLESFSQTLSLAYAFTTRLTLQLFSQWMDAHWAFRDCRSWHAAGGGERVAMATPQASGDRLWNLNLLARWEFRPGSTLFAVYTHGASLAEPANTLGRIRPGSDLARLHHVPSDDALQLKVSWLFR